jgi:hypothetical protein
LRLSCYASAGAVACLTVGITLWLSLISSATSNNGSSGGGSSNPYNDPSRYIPGGGAGAGAGAGGSGSLGNSSFGIANIV